MIKTINLSAGTETEVELTGGCHVSIENRGTGIIYASKSAGVVAGADGVIAIDSGTSKKMKNTAAYSEKDGIYDYHGKIYLLSVSDGTAEIETGNYFFDGNSGGGGYDDTELKNEISEKENKSNKVTSISETSTDTEYPSAKAVYDLANAGYEVKKITLNNDIGYRSWQADVYKFPNNLGIIFLNIKWDNPSDTYDLKIGTMPNDCKPLFPVAQNIVSNGYLNNKNIAYLNVETTGEIYVHTGIIDEVVPPTGIRLTIPYIIA